MGWEPGDMWTSTSFLYECNYGLGIFFQLRLAAECVVSLSLSFIGLTSAICFLSYKEQ